MKKIVLLLTVFLAMVCVSTNTKAQKKNEKQKIVKSGFLKKDSYGSFNADDYEEFFQGYEKEKFEAKSNVTLNKYNKVVLDHFKKVLGENTMTGALARLEVKNFPNTTDRVVYTCDTNLSWIYRAPYVGEMGLYDRQTGKFVLSFSCGNPVDFAWSFEEEAPSAIAKHEEPKQPQVVMVPGQQSQQPIIIMMPAQAQTQPTNNCCGQAVATRTEIRYVDDGPTSYGNGNSGGGNFPSDEQRQQTEYLAQIAKNGKGMVWKNALGTFIGIEGAQIVNGIAGRFLDGYSYGNGQSYTQRVYRTQNIVNDYNIYNNYRVRGSNSWVQPTSNFSNRWLQQTPTIVGQNNFVPNGNFGGSSGYYPVATNTGSRNSNTWP